MKKNLLLSLLFFTACAHLEKPVTTESLAKDAEHIRAFAGCYAVDFKFTETFPVKEGYALRKPQNSSGIEYVVVDVDKGQEIQLQHILVSHRGGKVGALKHWRQEWIYNPSQISQFEGNHTWRTQSVSAPAGSWNQRVTQTDDSPRYECVAKWVNLEKGSYWECQSWNPLPRREYTSRNDYQVLDRLNRQKLTEYGWVHEQDSTKLQLQESQPPQAVVKERGENTYRRIADEQCVVAKKWWNERRENWKAIRRAWQDVYKENTTLTFNFKSEEGELIKKLDRLDDEAFAKKMDANQVYASAKQTIDSFVKKETSAKAQ